MRTTPSLTKCWLIRIALFLLPWVFLVSITPALPETFPLKKRISNATAVTKAAVLEMFRRYDLAEKNLHIATDRDQRLAGKTIQWQMELLRKSGIKNFNEGHFSKALQYLNRISAYKFGSYFIRLYQGICYWKTGHPDMARNYLRKAIEIEPGNYDAYIALGHVLLLHGDKLNAYPYYLKGIAQSPKIGAVYADCGDAFRWTNDPETAIEFYRRGLDIDPVDPFCTIRMAEYQFDVLGHRDDAIRMLKRLAHRFPDWSIIHRLSSRFTDESPAGVLGQPFLRFGGIGHIRNSEIPDSRILFDVIRTDWCGSEEHHAD